MCTYKKKGRLRGLSQGRTLLETSVLEQKVADDDDHRHDDRPDDKSRAILRGRVAIVAVQRCFLSTHVTSPCAAQCAYVLKRCRAGEIHDRPLTLLYEDEQRVKNAFSISAKEYKIYDNWVKLCG